MNFRTERCSDCARPFLKSEPSMRRCRLCSALRADDLEGALAEKAWQEGFRLGYERAQQQNTRDPGVVLALPLLEDAIKLCHPDRHPEERFQLANSLTAELIRLRDTLRDGLKAA